MIHARHTQTRSTRRPGGAPEMRRKVSGYGAIGLLILMLAGCAHRPSPATMENTQPSPRVPHPEAMAHYVQAELYAQEGDYQQAITHFTESLRLDPEAAEIWVAFGEMLLSGGYVADAGVAAERAIALEPNGASAARLLAGVRWAQGRIEEAAAEYRRLAVLDPEDLESQFQLGILLTQNERADEAMEVLERIRHRSSLPPGMLIEIGRIYKAAGDYERAIEAYETFLEQRPKNAQALRELAQAYSEAGNEARAIAALQRVVSLRPGDIGSWRRLQGFYVQQGDLTQAFIVTEEIVRRDSTDILSRKQHAVLQEQMGNSSAALEEWKAITEMDPGDATVWEHLAYLLWRDEQMGAAGEAFETAHSLGSESMAVYQGLGSLYIDEGRFDRARSILAEGVDRHPDSGGIAFLLGVAIQRGGDPEQGLVYLQRAEELTPDREEVLFEIGVSLEVLGRIEESAELFRRVIAINPLNAAAYNYIGYMYAERGIRLDEAVQLITRALELDPENGSYLDSLGWAFSHQGKFEAAERALRRAAEMKPDEPIIFEHLGALYLRLGRLEEAGEAWERAVEMNPDNAALAEELRSVKEKLER